MNINKKVLFGATLGILLVGIVLGVVMYEKKIPMQMKLKATYHLELRQTDGVTVITSYNWGEFNESELKTLNCRLYNTGNKEAVVTAVHNLDLNIWRVFVTDTSASPPKRIDGGGTTTIPIGAYVNLRIELEESLALSGQQYAFDLTFQVLE